MSSTLTARGAAEAVRRRFNREAEAHALIPRSLSSAERGSDPVLRSEPVPVKAWIDYGNASTQVLGAAVAWSRRCVLVLWVDSPDQQQEAWIWAGAVERVEPCASCGGAQLVAVLLPGHAHVGAVVCLTCGAMQPASEEADLGRAR